MATDTQEQLRLQMEMESEEEAEKQAKPDAGPIVADAAQALGPKVTKSINDGARAADFLNSLDQNRQKARSEKLTADAEKMGQGAKDLGLKALNGLSLGFAPAMKGALETVEKIHGPLLKNENGNLGLSDESRDLYRYYRGDAQKQMDDASKRLGGLGTATELAAALPLPVPAPAKGASLLTKAGVYGGTGALYGGVSAAGHSDADLTKGEWSKFLTDVGVGTGVGAPVGVVGGAVGEGIGKLGSIIGNKLSRKAEDAAVRAAGSRSGIENQLRKMGLTGKNVAPEGQPPQTDIQRMGREFLDEKLIPWGGSKQEVMTRAQKLQDEAGDVVGKYLEEADKVAAQKAVNAREAASGAQIIGEYPLSATPGEIAEKGALHRYGLRYDELAQAGNKVLEDANAVERLAGGKSEALLKAIKDQGELTPYSFRGANDAKSAAWKSASFKDDAPLSKQLYRQTVAKLRDNIQNQLRRNVLNRNLPSPQMDLFEQQRVREAAQLANEIEDAFQKANNRYSVGARAEQLAEEGATREASHTALGMTGANILGGGSGAALMHVLGGGSAPMAAGTVAGSLLGAAALNAARGRALGPMARGLSALGSSHPAALRLMQNAASKVAPAITGAASKSPDDSLQAYLNLLPQEKDEPKDWESFFEKHKDQE